MYNGSMYVAIEGKTTISFFSQTAYQDFGTNFTTRYTTEDITGDTMNWKNCHRMYLIADMFQHTGESNVVITWSDNDWADGGSTAPRNINVFSSSAFIRHCGRFRNRSIRLEYTDNYPLRMVGMELDVNVMGV